MGPSHFRRSRTTVFHWSSVGPSSLPRFFQISQWTHRALHRSVRRIITEAGRQRCANRPPAKFRSLKVSASWRRRYSALDCCMSVNRQALAGLRRDPAPGRGLRQGLRLNVRPSAGPWRRSRRTRASGSEPSGRTVYRLADRQSAVDQTRRLVCCLDVEECREQSRTRSPCVSLKDAESAIGESAIGSRNPSTGVDFCRHLAGLEISRHDFKSHSPKACC